MQCWKLNETGQQWRTERGKNPWKDGGGSQWSQLSWPQTGKKSKKSQKKQSKKNGALPPIQFHSQTTNNRRQWATDEPKVSLSSSSHEEDRRKKKWQSTSGLWRIFSIPTAMLYIGECVCVFVLVAFNPRQRVCCHPSSSLAADERINAARLKLRGPGPLNTTKHVDFSNVWPCGEGGGLVGGIRGRKSRYCVTLCSFFYSTFCSHMSSIRRLGWDHTWYSCKSPCL